LSVAREPIFNAPWPPVLLVALILAGYGLQSLFDPARVVMALFAFEAAGVAAGRWDTLVTALFLHSSWAHALMNAAALLAFGSPVARLFGVGPRGTLVFFSYYLLCAALASLGFGLLHPGSTVLLVGASGAVSALMGASARIVAGRGLPGPFLSAPVLGMTGAWVAVNLIIALIGFAPGVGEGPVAWEAHLIGYAAGLMLLDLFTWAARGRRRR